MEELPLSMTNNYLEIRDVVKQFADHTALDRVSFSIPKESVFGLVGPNGAGKTTLIRIINQITAPDSGTVSIKGELLKPSHTANIGYLPEERGLYKKMKVLDQITYFGQLKNLPRMESLKRGKAWLDKFDIADWRHKKIEELSKGMAQKIQFIITVLHAPELLILDEPFSGFDPINTQLIKEEILELKRKGTTIIFSTHRMESIEEVCDHVGMINLSKKVLEGEVSAVRKNYKKNILEVEYEGDLGKLNSVAELNEENREGGWKAQFKIPEGSAKQLIAELNEQVHLTAFREKLPSIEEIFIQKVKEGGHE